MKEIIAHTVLGYPNQEECLKQLEFWNDIGLRHWELQVPFSHPTADGPLITEANKEGLENFKSLESLLNFIENIEARFPEVRIEYMSYAQKLFFLAGSDHAGRIKALKNKHWIVPDLPLDDELTQGIGDKLGLRFIPVIGLNTSKERIKILLGHQPDWLYLMSGFQTTGKQFQLSERLIDKVEEIRGMDSVKIGLGFGIRSLEDVNKAFEIADFAILGSIFMEKRKRGEFESFTQNLAGY